MQNYFVYDLRTGSIYKKDVEISSIFDTDYINPINKYIPYLPLNFADNFEDIVRIKEKDNKVRDLTCQICEIEEKIQEITESDTSSKNISENII